MVYLTLIGHNMAISVFRGGVSLINGIVHYIFSIIVKPIIFFL